MRPMARQRVGSTHPCSRDRCLVGPVVRQHVVQTDPTVPRIANTCLAINGKLKATGKIDPAAGASGGGYSVFAGQYKRSCCRIVRRRLRLRYSKPHEARSGVMQLPIVTGSANFLDRCLLVYEPIWLTDGDLVVNCDDL
jgi:hypothetical protein